MEDDTPVAKAPILTPAKTTPQKLFTAPLKTNSVEASGLDKIVGIQVEARSTPSLSSKVVYTFQDGDPVTVVARKQNWAKVAQNGITYWVLAQQISYAARERQLVTRNADIAERPMRRVKKSRTLQRGGISYGPCSCSAKGVCIGPRGGRYCMTSGGKKKYGV